ncbi:metallophosphoesterase [Halobacillus yeomjeoni]|uniref:metallophosphoesterase n=1 Tax=Halobacillus yeomjeoni TaxID=311194 RepID=UPI001CD23999|nr:metallophosphoesterase [Halobacillus yeomjeoni]MCA0983406.1 metallophosphoesterase [Halobacillus yeomjeoni]
MKKIIKKIGIFTALLLSIVLIWGLIEPYLINVQEEEAEIQNLPPQWEGEKIAVIGDFQVGMWMDNESILPRVVEKIIEKDPASVLITGDYIYHPTKGNSEEMETVIDGLRPLTEANIPVYAVLGNHDYAMSKKTSDPNEKKAQQVASQLQSIGVEILHNETTPLEKGNDTESSAEDKLYLTGVGAFWPEKTNVSKAIDIPPQHAPRIVLMHNPEVFAKLPAGSAPLAVAGHTHGGQISVPFTPQWSYKDLLAKDESHVDGWIDDEYGERGNQLYVNRGLGLSVLPLRVLNMPEITMFKLTSS